MIKRLTIFFVLLLAIGFISKANAQVNVFTDHQVVSMLSHGVNKNDDVRFPTGDYPYIGKIGVEYIQKKITYSLAFIHRSNVDLWKQDEYNYNGIAVGIKYAYCLIRC